MRITDRAVGLAAVGALLLVGCSATTSQESSNPSSAPSAPSSSTASTPAGSTDSSGGDSATTSCRDDQATFPITIEHALGTTVIEQKPERVASVAWANHEVPIALGVIPVGMSKATWGDDDTDGVLPWVEEALATHDVPTPVLFDETDGVDFEAVAASDPDLILAPYSGLTAEEYQTLAKIAPVVAYPEVAWGTSWQDMIRLSSTALGRACEGEALLAQNASLVDAAFAAHPELHGKKVLFAYIDPADLSQIGFYTSHDTRPGFLAELGIPMPEIVGEVSATTNEFYTTVSAEQADRFADVDLFVTYGDPGSDFVQTLQADPLLGQIPAIRNGAVAILSNSTSLAASANPSPLSIGWGIDDYFDVLAAPLVSAK